MTKEIAKSGIALQKIFNGVSGKSENIPTFGEFKGWFRGEREDRVYFIAGDRLCSLNLDTLEATSLLVHDFGSNQNMRELTFINHSETFCGIHNINGFLVFDLRTKTVVCDLPPCTALISGNTLFYCYFKHNLLCRRDLINGDIVQTSITSPTALSIESDLLTVTFGSSISIYQCSNLNAKINIHGVLNHSHTRNGKHIYVTDRNCVRKHCAETGKLLDSLDIKKPINMAGKSRIDLFIQEEDLLVTIVRADANLVIDLYDLTLFKHLRQRIIRKIEYVVPFHAVAGYFQIGLIANVLLIPTGGKFLAYHLENGKYKYLEVGSQDHIYIDNKLVWRTSNLIGIYDVEQDYLKSKAIQATKGRLIFDMSNRFLATSYGYLISVLDLHGQTIHEYADFEAKILDFKFHEDYLVILREHGYLETLCLETKSLNSYDLGNDSRRRGDYKMNFLDDHILVFGKEYPRGGRNAVFYDLAWDHGKLSLINRIEFENSESGNVTTCISGGRLLLSSGMHLYWADRDGRAEKLLDSDGAIQAMCSMGDRVYLTREYATVESLDKDLNTLYKVRCHEGAISLNALGSYIITQSFLPRRHVFESKVWDNDMNLVKILDNESKKTNFKFKSLDQCNILLSSVTDGELMFRNPVTLDPIAKYMNFGDSFYFGLCEELEEQWIWTNNTDLVDVYEVDTKGDKGKLLTHGDEDREAHLKIYNSKEMILKLLMDKSAYDKAMSVHRAAKLNQDKTSRLLISGPRAS